MQFTDEERAGIAAEYGAKAIRLRVKVLRLEVAGQLDTAARLRAQARRAEALVEAAREPDAQRSNALLSRIY